jgi:hypothetical protein
LPPFPESLFRHGFILNGFTVNGRPHPFSRQRLGDIETIAEATLVGIMSEVIIPLNPPFSKGDERGIFYKEDERGIFFQRIDKKVLTF